MPDLTLTPADEQRLELLRDLWRRYGAAINLTASLERAALEAHITEALHLVQLARRLGLAEAGTSWVDVGSGGGFPGLVIAATTPVSLTMVEPRERRASFLELALASLKRDDCHVVRARLRERGWAALDRAQGLEMRSDCACSRATFSPSRWLTLAGAVVRSGGWVFAHLQVESDDPPGYVAMDRVDDQRWSVRAYQVS